jgi:hypothetical protein
MMPLVQVVDVVGRVLDLEEVVGEGGGGVNQPSWA